MSHGLEKPSTSPEDGKVHSGALMAHACRFPAGADLVPSLRQAAESAAGDGNSSAVSVLSCVGSLSSLKLRMADAKAGEEATVREWKEPLEIVSMIGTFAVELPTDRQENTETKFHIHMAVSDAHGNVYGGHLMQGSVHTTLELFLGSIAEVHFARTMDASTGYRELRVSGSTKDKNDSTTNDL